MALAFTNPVENIPHEPGHLTGQPFPTYAHLEPGLSHERVARAFAAEIASLKDCGSVRAMTCSDGDTTGTAYWRIAEWEMKHLGYWCARLDQLICPASSASSLKDSLLARLKDEWRTLCYRYIFTRIDTADHDSMHALEKAGFLTVDNISLFACQVGKDGDAAAALPAGHITPATEEDIFHLTRIAREAFQEDRFHNDPLIPNEKADAMHGDWIRNQVMNGLAEEVLVARVDGQPVGFVSMLVDRAAREHLGVLVGTIALLAVDGSVRGQGFGKTLTRAALDWFRRHDVSFAQVGTQAWNFPAVRTYLGTGFKPARSYTTLRLHLA